MYSFESVGRREIHCIPLTTSQQLSSWRGQLRQEERAQRIAQHNNQKVYKQPTMPLTSYMPPTRLAAVLAASNASRDARRKNVDRHARSGRVEDAAHSDATATNKELERPRHEPTVLEISDQDTRILNQGRNAEAIKRALGAAIARAAGEQERKPSVHSSSVASAKQTSPRRAGAGPPAAASQKAAAVNWRSGKTYLDFLHLAREAHQQVEVESNEAGRRTEGQYLVHYPWRTDFDDPPPEVIASMMAKHAAASQYHANGGLLNPWGTQRDLPKPVVPRLHPRHMPRIPSATPHASGSSTGIASVSGATRASSARAARTKDTSKWLDDGTVKAAGISLGKGGYSLSAGSPRAWRSAW
mmetsp:Transcript_9275/g.28061  ORF Transcript_9275/g.28061 Transcript_9275/m.28061 type:complete len:357 (-) Transcript_9275:395-1465(-)